MVAGMVRTGLELWSGKECAKSYFRQRMWGTMSMLQIIMLNTRCWLQHMSLSQASRLSAYQPISLSVYELMSL